MITRHQDDNADDNEGVKDGCNDPHLVLRELFINVLAARLPNAQSCFVIWLLLNLSFFFTQFFLALKNET